MHIWNQKNVYAKWKSFMHSVKYIMHGNNCWFQLYPFVFFCQPKSLQKNKCAYLKSKLFHIKQTYSGWYNVGILNIQDPNAFTGGTPVGCGWPSIHWRPRVKLEQLKVLDPCLKSIWATTGSTKNHKDHKDLKQNPTWSKFYFQILHQQNYNYAHCSMCIYEQQQKGRREGTCTLHGVAQRPQKVRAFSTYMGIDRQIGFWPFFLFYYHIWSDSCRYQQECTKKCRNSPKKTQKKIDEIRRNNWFLDVFFGFSTKFDEIRRRVLRCFVLKNTSLFFKSLLS